MYITVYKNNSPLLRRKRERTKRLSNQTILEHICYQKQTATKLLLIMIMIISQQRSFNACTTWRHLFYQKIGVDWFVTNIEPLTTGKVLVSGFHNGSQKDWKQPNSRSWLAKMDWRRRVYISRHRKYILCSQKGKKGTREKKQNKRNQRSYNNGKHKRE